MSVGYLEKIDNLIDMLAAAKERTIKGNVTLVAGEMPVLVEQFGDVFRHPLQAISNPLWLIGRWRAMNFCQQKPDPMKSIITIV